MSAIGVQLAGLKVVPWPPSASDRVVDGTVGFWADDRVVRGDRRWFAVPYRIRALENVVVALKYQVDLIPVE
jgi:hypothetical protein